MKYWIMLVLLLSSTASALDCDGHIVEIYSWPNKCDGNYAYKIDAANSRWICSVSDKSDALILLAYTSKKLVRSRVNANSSETCVNLTTDFLTHDFIRLMQSS